MERCEVIEISSDSDENESPSPLFINASTSSTFVSTLEGCSRKLFPSEQINNGSSSSDNDAVTLAVRPRSTSSSESDVDDH